MNNKITRKLIHKIWNNYMIAQFNEKYAEKFGKYDLREHSIRDTGNVIVSGKFGREVLEEVGLDYRTFRMKYNTSSNPLGI